MNAERLHAIVIALQHEMTKRSTVAKMQALVNGLQTVIDNPHPSHQEALAQARKALEAALTDTPSDVFGPAWRQVLKEINGEDLFGATLKEEIERIFSRNQITPAVALKEFQELLKNLEAFQAALTQTTSCFRHFQIGDEKLAAGECEIGVLIPRDAVGNQLLSFAKELKDVGFILNTFAEVATGKKDDLSIRTISSTDLLVYLEAGAAYGACLTFAIERIVTLYKQLLEIRKLRQSLGGQGVPEDKMMGIEQYANSLMEDNIETIAVEVVKKFHKKADKGRENELTNAVRVSLRMMANRIDHGFNIEVRAEPPSKPKEGEQPDEKLSEAIAAIQAASKSMEYMKLEGQPILKLPEIKESPKKKE